MMGWFDRIWGTSEFDRGERYEERVTPPSDPSTERRNDDRPPDEKDVVIFLLGLPILLYGFWMVHSAMWGA